MNPFTRIARLYMRALEERPVLTKMLTSAAMYGIGDVIAQKAAPDTRQEPIDWKRVAVFGSFGLAVAGPLYHLWFNNLDRLPFLMMQARKFQQTVELRSLQRRATKLGIKLPPVTPPQPKEFRKSTYLISKVLADQFVFSPAYLGIFFYGTGLMSGRSVDECTHHVKYALAVMRPLVRSPRCRIRRQVYVPTFAADCAIWPIVQAVNFSVVPVALQPLTVNVVNLFWNAFLSFMANKAH